MGFRTRFDRPADGCHRPPCGRICGKSVLDSVLRADAAKKKAKRQELVDASAARRCCNAVLPQMRPVALGRTAGRGAKRAGFAPPLGAMVDGGAKTGDFAPPLGGTADRGAKRADYAPPSVRRPVEGRKGPKEKGDSLFRNCLLRAVGERRTGICTLLCHLF